MKKSRIFFITIIVFFSYSFQIFNFINYNLLQNTNTKTLFNDLYPSAPDSIIFEQEWPIYNTSGCIFFSSKINISGDVYFVGIRNETGILFKVNSSFGLQWNRLYSIGNLTMFRDLTFDNSGNIYLVGSTFNYDNFSSSILIVKYNYTGGLQWSRTVGNYEGNSGSDITSDSKENIYVTGSIRRVGEESDIIVIKYDSDGNMLWNRTFGDILEDFSNIIQVDSLDNIYVGGYIRNPISGDNYLFLAKIKEDNTLLWERLFGIGAFYCDIFVDPNNDIYVIGNIGNHLLVKYDSNGNNLWNNTGGNCTPFSITLDSFNNIYIAGSEDNKACIAKFHSNGTYIETYLWGTNQPTHSFSIECLTGNVLYLSCYDEFSTGALTWFVKFVLDNDEDGLSDLEEINTYSTDPLDIDSDDDGLTDGEEINIYSTNPNNIDSDGDNMPDGWEVLNSLNPIVDDSFMDNDFDGLSNLEEYQLNIDPNDSDTDNDGLNDGIEVNTYGTDPNDSDTDNDGFSDGEEVNSGFDPLDRWNNPIMLMIYIILIITFISLIIIYVSLLLRKRINIKKERIAKELYEKKKLELQELSAQKKLELESQYSRIEELIRSNEYLNAKSELRNLIESSKEYEFNDIISWAERRIDICDGSIIRKTVLELGTRFSRLEVAEITEKTGIQNKDLIIQTIKSMIEEKEIYAQYFSSSNSVVFNQQANIDEIDRLMAIYKDWEEEKLSKKK